MSINIKKENKQEALENKKLQKQEETSKTKFLKEINSVKFEITEDELLSSKAINQKIYVPCNKIKAAIENYNKAKTSNKSKFKKPEFLKFKLSKKHLDAILISIKELVTKPFKINKNYFELRAGMNSLSKSLNGLKKSIILPSSANRNIKKAIDSKIKELKKIIDLIQKNKDTLYKKLNEKEIKKEYKIHLQHVTISGVKVNSPNSESIVSPYNIYIPPIHVKPELVTKISSIRNVMVGKEFYKTVVEKKSKGIYNFDQSKEWDNNESYLFEPEHLNQVASDIKKIEGVQLFIQEPGKKPEKY